MSVSDLGHCKYEVTQCQDLVGWECVCCNSGRVQVIEKLIDYRTPAVSELTKRHNGGIQGRLIQRPESITPQSVRVPAMQDSACIQSRIQTITRLDP